MSFSPADDDEDSLFGSPPPSPGRSPSPALALPGRASVLASGSIDTTVTKNVGTIALPGSQPSSELFVDPIAPILALPMALSSLPPPLNPIPSFTNQSVSRNRGTSVQSAASSSSGPSSRQAGIPLPQRPRKRKAKPASKESTPRAEVQIALPDPSAPPPANFLRSQTALLGVAGLVGGVNPSQLKVRGATPSNPIVIEDEPVTSNPTSSLSFRPPTNPLCKPLKAKSIKIATGAAETIDLTTIPMPSKQEILSVLIKEKDIVPIIQNLMKLGTGSVSNPPTSGPRWSGAELQGLSQKLKGKGGNGTHIVGTHSTTGYPMKKRKLSRVPAGAADWDVPYPFNQGEGPQSYQQTWESDRVKQLIAQLVNLGKVATMKAAVQKYVKSKPAPVLPTGETRATDDELRKNYYKTDFDARNPKAHYEDGPRINRYYKPITATYGLNIQKSGSNSETISRQATPTDSVPRQSCYSTPSSSTPVVGPSQGPSTASSPPPEHSVQEAESLDEFLSSLYAMTQPQAAADQPSIPPTNVFSSFASVGLPSSNANEDLLDSWMRMLHPSSGVPEKRAEVACSPSSTSPSTPTPFSADLDAFFSGLPLDEMKPSNPMTSPLTVDQGYSHDAIDPDLLALALSTSGPFTGAHTMSSAPSPIPSTSSFAGGPMTPVSVDWDMGVPDVAGVPNHGDSYLFSEMKHGMYGRGLDGWDIMGALDKLPPLQRVNAGENHGSDLDVLSSSTSPTTVTSQGCPPEEAFVPLPFDDGSGSSPSSTPPPTISATPQSQQPGASNKSPKPALSTQKEDVVRRVKARKAELEAELKMVKLQLWEATIEQGGLNHVLQLYQEDEQRDEESQVLAPIVNISPS